MTLKKILNFFISFKKVIFFVILIINTASIYFLTTQIVVLKDRQYSDFIDENTVWLDFGRGCLRIGPEG